MRQGWRTGLKDRDGKNWEQRWQTETEKADTGRGGSWRERTLIGTGNVGLRTMSGMGEQSSGMKDNLTLGMKTRDRAESTVDRSPLANHFGGAHLHFHASGGV